MARFTIVAGLTLLICLQVVSSSKPLLCYFTNWAQYRPGAGRYLPANIDPNLCTHLIYAFATINQTNQLATFTWDDLFKDFNGLKRCNPELKTLLAVEGWDLRSSTQFGKMVESNSTRQEFITSAIDFLRQHDFDGLDLDWEYPGEEDKEGFTLLCKELHAAFEKEGVQNARPRLLLSAAVAAEKEHIDNGYDIFNISMYLDFINVMTYNFHGPWEPFTGHFSPLYRSSSKESKTQNVDFAMKYWKKQGAPAEKLMLGFATYGITFNTSSADAGVGSPASSPGSAGYYTEEAGLLSYFEICINFQRSNLRWIDKQMVPFATKDKEWVGFENRRSFTNKVKYLKDNNFGGAFVWSIDLDDFSGEVCGQDKKYPLISHLRSLLDSGYRLMPNLSATTTTAAVAAATTTVAPDSNPNPNLSATTTTAAVAAATTTVAPDSNPNPNLSATTTTAAVAAATTTVAPDSNPNPNLSATTTTAAVASATTTVAPDSNPNPNLSATTTTTAAVAAATTTVAPDSNPNPNLSATTTTTAAVAAATTTVAPDSNPNPNLSATTTTAAVAAATTTVAPDSNPNPNLSATTTTAAVAAATTTVAPDSNPNPNLSATTTTASVAAATTTVAPDTNPNLSATTTTAAVAAATTTVAPDTNPNPNLSATTTTAAVAAATTTVAPDTNPNPNLSATTTTAAVAAATTTVAPDSSSLL